MKNIFRAMLEQDMGKQAKLVEIATLIVFFLLLFVASWLWQFKIDITVPGPAGERIVIDQVNIFELLLSKK